MIDFRKLVYLLFAVLLLCLTSGCQSKEKAAEKIPATTPEVTLSNGFELDDGSVFYAPEEVEYELSASKMAVVTGAFKGVTLHDKTQQMSGFVSRIKDLSEDPLNTGALVDASGDELNFDNIRERMTKKLEEQESIKEVRGVAVSSGAEEETILDSVGGNFSVTTTVPLSPSALSALILKTIGVHEPGGKADNIPELDSNLLTTDFRMDLAILYKNNENVFLIVALTTDELYESLQGTMNATANVFNIVAPGSYLKAGADEYTAREPVTNADFLVVIDHSGSMFEEQESIAKNAAAFFDKLESAGFTFNLGVITTGPQQDKDGNIIQGTQLRGEGFTNSKASFQNAIKAGTTGSPSESGIFHAEQALKETGLDEKGKLDPNIDKGSVVTAGYPRAGAQLSVLLISDEPDQYTSYSDESRPFNFSNNVFTEKGYIVHAIVADPDSGCSGDGGSAGGTPDYKTLTRNTGGTFGNICQSDYSATLDMIVQQAGGNSYSISIGRAIYSQIKVSVNGKNVLRSSTNGFLYNSNTRNISFLGNAVPTKGSKIAVSYTYPALNLAAP
ncbi:hypothetical protein WDW89_12195 [Deltaproteobacteria bacterium TL4]